MKARPYTIARSNLPIKAPAPKLERCRIGKKIMSVRAQTVNQTKTMDEFYLAEGRGWMKYCRHEKRCLTCKAYENSKREKQDKRFNKQEHK